jgi:hypothetical protein
VSGDRLYLESGTGKVACYETGNGRQVWAREMKEFGASTPQWAFSESVLVVKNLAVITPGGKDCIVGLDKATGATRWRSEGNGGRAQYGSPLLAVCKNVPMIITGTSAGLVAVHAESGKILWENDFSTNNTANCPTPAYSAPYVFWANGYGRGGICLELSSAGPGSVRAREVWRTEEMDCHHGGYIIHDGHIYGNHGGGWACLELKTGKRMWYSNGVGKGSLCYADGMLYLFGEHNGRVGLATASPVKFEMRGQFSVAGAGPSWAHPVVSGGRLYLRYHQNLYCYDVRGKGRRPSAER